MGGLISDTDQRRLNRPAENSPEAFEAALAETTHTVQAPPQQPVQVVAGLDGVECDVFLSKDGVPIVSHEGKVREQLNAVQKAAVRDVTRHTEIKHLRRPG